MSEQEPGLRIGDKFYPFVSSYTLGEARVLKQLTGMTLAEFARRVEEVDEDGTPKVASDPDHLVFLIWVAMHRENPKITVQDVEAMDIETTFSSIEGVDVDDLESDAGPPVEESAAVEESGESFDVDLGTAGPQASSANGSETSTDSSQERSQLTSGLSG